MLKYLLFLLLASTAFGADGDRILRNPNTDKALLLQVSPGGTPQTAISVSGTTGQVSFPQGATGVAGVTNEVTNGLANFSFEGGVANWTASGGSFTQVGTPNNLADSFSGQWSGATTNDTLTSDAWTIPKKMYGKSCLISGAYANEVGDAGDYTVLLWDGSVETLIEEIDLNKTTATATGSMSIGFVCPSTGTVALRFKAKVAAPDPLQLDDLHLGSDFRVGVQNDQAELIAVIKQPGTTNCGVGGWGNVSTNPITPTQVSTDTDCIAPVFLKGPYGGAVGNLTDTNFPKISFSYLPPGKYAITAAPKIAQSLSGTDGLRISDGAALSGIWQQYRSAAGTFYATGNIEATFEYATGGARDFEIFLGSNAGVANAVLSNRSTEDFEWNVYRFPNQSPRDTVTLETAGKSWSATIGGANMTLGTTSTAAFVEPSNASETLTAASGSSSVGVACSAPATETQEVGDTTCTGSEGNEVNGVVINIPYAGAFYACNTFGVYHQLNVSEEIVDYFRLAVTANNSTTELLTGGKKDIRTTTVADGSDYNIKQVQLCDIFSFSAAGTYRFVSQFASSMAGAFPSSNHQIQAFDSGTNSNISWSIIPVSQNFPQAVAIANVETGATADCTKGNICSGTWTPVASNTTNFDATPTGAVSSYSRIGNVVTIGLKFSSTDIASGAAIASFRATVPIASGNFTSVSPAFGTCTTKSTSTAFQSPGWTVEPVNATQQLFIHTARPEDGGAIPMFCNVTYEIP